MCIIAAFLMGLLWSGRHCAAPGSCHPSPHRKYHHPGTPAQSLIVSSGLFFPEQVILVGTQHFLNSSPRGTGWVKAG